MRRVTTSTLFCAVLVAVSAAVMASCTRSLQTDAIPENDIWTRPVILPLPVFTGGTSTPVVSLSGAAWKITVDPPDEFWMNDVDPATWRDVRVPSSVDKQGISAQAYAYKARIGIPGEFSEKRIFLRFEGVTGTARAWVNGVQVGEHHGGFTIWNPEITDHVAPGQDAWLTVAIREPGRGDSSNGYGGGIIRDIQLVAVPESHLIRFNVETDLDENYRNATIKVWSAVEFGGSASGNVHLSLKDSNGETVSLRPNHIELTRERPEVITEIPVSNPLKWDAEHPNLYTLEARLEVDGQTTEVVTRKVGFREVEISGRTLLVNGQEIKMRGSGQFDSHPLNGRTLTAEEAERDVRLYKRANHNYVRPACYPASEALLDACDRLGLYVEGEAPVTFTRGTESDPELIPLFLGQTAEMIEANRSHPSIIIWNLANESSYGVSIRRMSEYIRAEEPTRPIVFSWSHRIPPEDPLPYDIYSYHYPNYTDDVGAPGVAVFNAEATREYPPTMPVLSDEYAHPVCYNRAEMQRDPAVRNFWGEGIKIFWEEMHETHGSLGGAIWAFIDENSRGTSIFAWGLVDLWRRERPEFWLTKKAYSPVRIAEEPLTNPGAGAPLDIPIQNWYDHTNLKELTVEWNAGWDSGTLQGPDVPPDGEGRLRIPGRQWQSGDVVNLKFFGQLGYLVDEYNLEIDPPAFTLRPASGPAPDLTEAAGAITVSGDDFQILFSKQTGLMTRGSYRGSDLIKSGPYLHLTGADLASWSFRSIKADSDGEEAVVNIAGAYGPVEVSYEVRIDGQGLITTNYTLDKFPIVPPETRVVPWNRTHAGGFAEVGISYVLTGEVDRLSWRRKGLWSAYPEDHIGRIQGVAPRSGRGAEMRPGVEPTWPWAEDEKDFNLYGENDQGGRGTHDFRGMKEYIYYASAIAGPANRVRAESNATDAVRLEVADAKPDDGVRFIIDNLWNYPEIGLGNYMKPPVIVGEGYSNQVRFRLTDRDSDL